MVQKLNDSLDSEKYSADKINALTDAKGCEELLNELKAAFDNLKTANDNLPEDKKVNIDGVTDKYNNAVTLINDRNGEITKTQNAEKLLKTEEIMYSDWNVISDVHTKKLNYF